jgi:uncharacterized protein (TIGR02246 family)
LNFRYWGRFQRVEDGMKNRFVTGLLSLLVVLAAFPCSVLAQSQPGQSTGAVTSNNERSGVHNDYATASTVPTSSCSSPDEGAIRHLVEDFETAATTHDAVKYAAVFAEDVDWENAFGDHKLGRKALAQGMVTVMQTFTTAKETVSEVSVLCIRPDLALVDIYATIEGQMTPRGRAIPTRHIRMTQIHEKRDGKWVVRAHRVADLRGDDRQLPGRRGGSGTTSAPNVP